MRVRPFALILCLATAVCGQEARLTFAVVLSRHGVRSPTWTRKQLREYSADDWPDWGVGKAELTPHGFTLMKLFGSYYGQYFAQAGLLSPTDCSAAKHIFIWADTDQRTLQTGRAISEGLMPGCSVAVQSAPAGKKDVLFDGSKSGSKTPDPELAKAAVAGRIGRFPAALIAAHQPAFETLDGLLWDSKATVEGQQRLLEMTSDDSDALPAALRAASTLSEVFLLEYANGMEGKDLGWGRLNEGKLTEVMSLHGVYSDLARRTPYIAQTRGSNLLSHIVASMEQSMAGAKVANALGNPEDRMLFLIGHDTNLSNLSGMLSVSWSIPGFQENDTPPGGALVFELWKQGAQYKVRTYYISQTLEQMQRAVPLTLQAPPPRAAVFVPGCSTSTEGFDCDWKDFRRVAQQAIDPAFRGPMVK